MIEIKSWMTGEVLCSVEKDTLVGANLIDANLIRANLIRANLRGAILCDANLNNAVISYRGKVVRIKFEEQLEC